MNVAQKLPVMEEFLTIQGEGRNAGKVAYFIRLGGCDVGCSWCDVKESWDAHAHPQKTVAELVASAKASGSPNVVITGGEPAMHSLENLTIGLKEAGLNTWLETSGSSTITGVWDWICLSPKKFKAPLDESLGLAHEFKVVVLNKSDLRWAETMTEKLHKNCELYFQPEWEKREKATILIIDYVKKHTQWSISLQTHKYINIP